jgi:DNA-binding transcriptional LysR family regulator
MDWDDLRMFLAWRGPKACLARARCCGWTRPPWAAASLRLEEALGARLFAKSPQGYALTEAGQRLLPHAEAAEQAMAGRDRRACAARRALSGQIRIGAPDGCANYLLPQVVAAICDRQSGAGGADRGPAPRLQPVEARGGHGHCRLAPAAGRLTVQKPDRLPPASGRQRRLPGPPRPPQTRADLHQHRIVGYIPDMIFDKELDYLAEIGATKVPLASNSVSVQLNWLRHGAGLGVVHDFRAARRAGTAPRAGRMTSA